MYQLATPTVTVVHAIDIDCSVAKTFDFMHDAPQWLPWAMPQVESVKPLPFGQWLLKMPNGLAKLRSSYDTDQYTIDYELVDPTAGAWHVPVLVIPTRTGCHLAITFVKPDYLPLDTFETSMQHTAAGLNTLKLVLEQD